MSATPSDGITTVIAFVVLGFAPLLLWWLTLRVRKGKRYVFRRIPAFDALSGLFGMAAEDGKTVHLALGDSGISDAHTAVVSSGLVVLRYLAEQGASLGTAPTVTVADPTLMVVAQDILLRAYQRKGMAAYYSSTDVHMVAPDPTAYAIGAQNAINDEDVAANVMVGHFGEEYLLLGEASAQRDIDQMVGTDDLNAHPFVVSTTDRALMGEEVFAAGAYLTERPEHIASLRLQDILRTLIVLAILGLVAVRTVLGQ
jgi:hypothetical protein